MPIPSRRSLKTDEEDLEILCCDDGSRTLLNLVLDETYHSGCGAVSESLWVYLLKSGVAERLAGQHPTTIVEYGFGTGTSFLLTAAYALLCETPISYVGLENRILPKQILKQFGLSNLFTRALTPNAAIAQGEFKDVLAAIQPLLKLSENKSIEDFADCLRTCEQKLLEDWEPQSFSDSTTHQVLKLTPLVDLHLVIGDAGLFDAARLCALSGASQCDSIYFDPFAPQVSPELWDPRVYESMLGMLKPDSSVTSYCVKGVVQRELRNTGFDVTKVPGPPGGKREVLLAKPKRQFSRQS